MKMYRVIDYSPTQRKFAVEHTVSGTIEWLSYETILTLKNNVDMGFLENGEYK